MARIAGIELPKHKRIEVGLTYIFGIGLPTSLKVLRALNIDPNTHVSSLSEAEIIKLREMIEKKYKIEGDLRRDISMNIKRLMDIACYRGLRHRRGLPVRGQQTQTNARTRKGPKRHAVGGKK